MGLVSLNCVIQTDRNEAAKEVKTIDNKKDLIQQYPECFDGIGKFQGQYHISIDPTVPAAIHPPRRIPLALKDSIKFELNDMEEKQIITKVREGEPTAWVNSLVYRKKTNGRLRLCLDPKDLNTAIRRDHHVVPTLEDLLPKLKDAKYFSIVDAKCGYWNVELTQESSYLTTFNSPFGRYRFLRMPFGLKMAQDVFQSKIDQTFEGCEGVIGISDDIVVFGTTEAEHDRHMHEMLTRCKATGLKLNPDKCTVKESKIKFYGIICGENGIQPDPDKVSALKKMQPPKDIQELQCFLGLATYMGKFIRNLSSLTAALREMINRCERFHSYLYGQSVTVESDHKPLESIHMKHITSAPRRLQKMLLRLQPYNITIKYSPGKDLKLADPLSRLSPEPAKAIPGMEIVFQGPGFESRWRCMFFTLVLL